MRVAIVDDDYWQRDAMARAIGDDDRFTVALALTQDEVLQETDAESVRWEGVDLVIVDVFDESAPAEIGADVFSGIAALDHLHRIKVERALRLELLAITTHCQHPLVQLRLAQSGANWAYHRWEVNSPELLIGVLLDPDPGHVPQRPAYADLAKHGSTEVDANGMVRAYERSAIAGRLTSDAGHDQLERQGVSRRAIDSFVGELRALKLLGSGANGLDFRNVRKTLLTLLGRRDAPPTEIDRDDAGHTHGL